MKIDPSKEDLVVQLRETQSRIAPHIHRTPVHRSTMLDQMHGAELFFKCENFQKGGSYKLRGALNAALQLTAPQKQRGVVTHSSGNFAAAVAIASRKLGIPNYIVVPEGATPAKIEAARAYGGNIIATGPTLADRVGAAQRIIDETGATLLHPSNDWNVILGQGTCTTELLAEVGELDACFCPVGGGGVIAGCCLALSAQNSARDAGRQCMVMGGEPMAADDAYRSLVSGQIESNDSTDTIADGLRSQLGDINFPIMQKHVREIVRVSEGEIVAALELLWTRLKVVVEPSSAVSLAAFRKVASQFQGKRVGFILTGGNIDLASLSAVLSGRASAATR